MAARRELESSDPLLPDDLDQASPHAALAEIVSRISLLDAAGEISEEFRSEIAAFGRLPAVSQEDVAAGVQRNLRRWWRWLATGVVPPDSDFDPLRDWARDRAAEGVGLEDLLRAFGIGGQLGWKLIRKAARPDEADLALDAAALLMEYVDRVSTVVTETYLTEREALVSEEERRARSLLEWLSRDEPLDPEHVDLAARLGVPVTAVYSPFAIVMPGRPPRRHAALARRLRMRGWSLTVTEGDRVVGLTWKPLDVGDLDEGRDVVLATAAPTPRGELGDAREELFVLLDHALRAGLRGRLQAEDQLLEILVARSPRITARLWAKIVAPLLGPEHEDLLRTLRTLVACDLDRAATSAALHIHRNTLAYRLGRISEMTGLDLDNPYDLAALYLVVGVAREVPA